MLKPYLGSRPTRRALYRCVKKGMYRWLVRRWAGSRASLDRRIRAFLRGRNRAYFLRLIQQQAFALAVVGALLAGSQTHASSPIELSDVALGTGGFVINGIDFYGQAGSVSGAGDVNGDGLDDLIVGAYGAEPGENIYAGESYVVFGKANATAVELSAVAAGTGGFGPTTTLTL